MFFTDPGERADHRELVGDLGEPGHVLADFHAVDIRGDRRELAAEFLRRERLQVEHVHVRRAAGQIDVDDRLAGGLRTRQRLRTEQFGESEAAEAERSDLQEIAARDAVTELLLRTGERPHGESFP